MGYNCQRKHYIGYLGEHMNFEYDAMTAGVKLGGLNSKHAIRILLCYIIHSVGKPITQQQLQRSIVATELANLFEFGDALSQLERKKLIVMDDNEGYYVTEDGRLVAETLHTEVPLTVREQAYDAAVNCLEYANITERTKVDITKTDNGSYLVNCCLIAGDKEVLTFSLPVDEVELAQHISNRISENGRLLYNCILATLTGSPGLYSEAMEMLKKR